MSGKGKSAKAKAGYKTRSARAGLQFPVSRVHRLLRKVCTRNIINSSRIKLKFINNYIFKFNVFNETNLGKIC